MGWVVSAMTQPVYIQKRPSTWYIR